MVAKVVGTAGTVPGTAGTVPGTAGAVPGTAGTVPGTAGAVVGKRPHKRQSDDPGTTVASVAGAAGYRQVGHFGVEYKRRFGENPRETLLRREGPRRLKGG